MTFPRTLCMALLFATALIPSALAGNEHLFHSMTVTAPGTRSQGWSGKLHDATLQELPLESGKHVSTNAGVFVGVPCALPWVPCGYIHEEQLRWMNSNGSNFIMGNGAWEYRLYVTSPCTRSEGWRGELFHNGRAVKTRRKLVKTPMGTFVRKSSAQPWGQNGWFHVSWPASSMAPGNWPCSRS